MRVLIDSQPTPRALPDQKGTRPAVDESFGVHVFVMPIVNLEELKVRMRLFEYVQDHRIYLKKMFH